MTIYTPNALEKKSEKEPDVITEPLTSFKDDVDSYEEKEGAQKHILVTYFPRNRRRFLIHLLLTLMVVSTLACSAIGAVLVFRHFNKHHKEDLVLKRCGMEYYDLTYHMEDAKSKESDRPSRPARPVKMNLKSTAMAMDYFEEQIEVSEIDMYESLNTPAFDEVRENTVLHDFKRNFTAVVDHEWERCYLMPLNRSRVSPPRDVIDFLKKLTSGYFMVKAEVVRENYRMLYPPLDNLAGLSKRIGSHCKHYSTFRVEKFVRGVYKRAVDVNEVITTYAMTSLKSSNTQQQTIYKMIFHERGLATNEKITA